MKRQQFHFIIITLFTILLFSCKKTVTINNDEAGVVYNNSNNTIEILKEGTHRVHINSSITKYSLRECKETISTEFLFKNGENGTIELMVNYSLKPESLANLDSIYGENYQNTFLKPSVRSTIRSTLNNLNEYQASIEVAESAITKNIINNNEITPYFKIIAVFVININSERIANEIKVNKLESACNKLESANSEVRIEAIDSLINTNKPIAYEIVLNHWEKEKDKNVKAFIIEQLMN